MKINPATRLRPISLFFKKCLLIKIISTKSKDKNGLVEMVSFNAANSIICNPADSISSNPDHSISNPSAPIIFHPDNWIIRLDEYVQLALATKLIHIIMQEWDTYCTHNDLVYLDTMSGRHNRINGDFLQNALHEIKTNASIIVLPDNIKYGHIKKCLDEFIPPVIAMTDGEWVVPYFIKKIILSVFNILKGLEHNNRLNKTDYFSKSISLSIEVIEARHLCAMNDLHNLLGEYRGLL